jgi:hypothetical protein
MRFSTANKNLFMIMKASIYNFAFCLTVLLFADSFWRQHLHAVTVNVGAGESIQSAIDNASAGDSVLLTAPGEYPGDINVTKAINLISVQRDFNNIGGLVTVRELESGQVVRFKNLSISTKVNLVGSSLDVVRCDLNEINATNPGGAECRLSILQSNVSSKLSARMPSVWVGYSNLRENYFEGNVELVGNDIDGKSMGGIGVDLVGENTNANIHNNLIHHFIATIRKESCIGIRVDANASAIIRNNQIYSNQNGEYRINDSYQTGIGVLVKSTRKTLIEANVFNDNMVSSYGNQGTVRGSLNIYTDSDQVSVTRNAFKDSQNFVASVRPLGVYGVTPYESITNTNLNVSGFLSSTTALSLGKESQDTGPPDPIHFDHDGSRNDIGPNGGHNYIPEGRTTDKPIPIFLSLTPQAVPIGGTVTIESTGATLK